MTSTRHRTRIKICGLTTPTQADQAVDLGADLIGLNFYRPSPRYVSERVAASIVERVAGRIPVVGVFVDEKPRRLRSIVDQVGLDLVQFHGSESLDSVAEWRTRALKVVRVNGDLTEIPNPEQFEEFWGVLFDTGDPRLAGGTGRMWDHSILSNPAEYHRRVFFAGGFTPMNIAAVVRRSSPFGVDASSGIESSPGVKDPELIKRFIEEIRNGEDRTAA